MKLTEDHLFDAQINGRKIAGDYSYFTCFTLANVNLLVVAEKSIKAYAFNNLFIMKRL